jgi:hypothetical protein
LAWGASLASSAFLFSRASAKFTYAAASASSLPARDSLPLQSSAPQAIQVAKSADKRARLTPLRRVWLSVEPPSIFSSPLFAAPFLDSARRLPADELFWNEMTIGDDAVVNCTSLRQNERALQTTGLFSALDAQYISPPPNERKSYGEPYADLSDAILTARLRPLFSPFAIVESGGGAITTGVGGVWTHLAEQALTLTVSAAYRSENDIGWQGAARADWFLSGDRVTPTFHIAATTEFNRFRFSQEIDIFSPAGEANPYTEWTANLSFHGGQDFVYGFSEAGLRQQESFQTTPFYSARLFAAALVNGSYWGMDFVLGGAFQAEIAEISRREADWYPQNLALLTAFLGTDEREEYVFPEGVWEARPSLTINGRKRARECNDCAKVGVYGTIGVGVPVELHNPSALSSGGLRRIGGIFPHLRLGVATFLSDYVYMNFHGQIGSEQLLSGELKLHFAFGNGVALANRWLAYRPNIGVAILDSYSGVRGYGANTGVSREGTLVWNMELRGFPLGEVGAYRLTGTLFADMGALLEHMPRNRTMLSVGAGVRLSYPALLNANPAEQGVVRIDLAFVPEFGRFGQIIVSTSEYFSLFEDASARHLRQIAVTRFVE